MVKTYDPEFRAQMVALHEAGQSNAEISKEHDVPKKTLGDWIAASKGIVRKTYRKKGKKDKGMVATISINSDSGKLETENRLLKEKINYLNKALVVMRKYNETMTELLLEGK